MELIVLKKQSIRTSLFTVFVVLLLISSQVANGSTIIIDESFDSVPNWEINSYFSTYNDGWKSIVWNKTNVTTSKIENNALQFIDTNASNYGYIGIDMGIAKIPCPVAYGQWSFDFNPDSVYSDFGMMFGQTLYENDDIDGLAENQFKLSGYGLFVSSSDAGLRGKGIGLMKYTNQYYGFKSVYKYNFTTPITGWNHIDIIRTTDDLITVIFNNATAFEWQDDAAIADTAENFWIGNWHGNTTFDNIQVTEFDTSTKKTAVPLNWLYTLTGIGFGVLVVTFSWNRAKKN